MQHHGISNIRIEGDYAEGSKYLRAAQQVLIRLQEMLRAGGVESGGLYQELSDRVYCYARVAGNINVLNIVADSELQIPGARYEKTISPDFLSGLVYRGYIEKRVDRSIPGAPREYETLVDFRPTIETAEKFEMPDGRQEVERLAVKPHSVLADALNNKAEGSPIVFSQYTVLRPTMYSGTMKKLVQFLMGYGKQTERSIYGREWEKVDPNAEPVIATQFQKEVAEAGLQIRYDWRFFRTHGLTKAADGKWWVVEIRQGRGIHALPLALHPETTTPEFRAKVEDMGDTEGLAVLDLFGGFPTGESFPSDTVEFDSWVRAGIILKQEDTTGLDAFYANTWYSSNMGWAFSESGAKAHNTGWRVGDDNLQRGTHYGIDITIGETEEITPHPLAGTLKRHVMAAKGVPFVRDFEKKIRGVRFKIDRMGEDEIRTILGETPGVAFDYIDRQQADPIAPFTAPCGKVGEGYLYWPTRRGPQIKFHDPDIGGLLSHDMRAAGPFPKRPFCDTVMHVFFTGETLRYVKFYSPADRQTINETEGEEPECPYATDWTITHRSGSAGQISGFYTDNFDDREYYSEHITVTKGSSKPTGLYDISLGDDPAHPWLSFANKSWKFILKSETTTTGGQSKSVAVAVPELMREAYYYAFLEGRTSRSHSINYAGQSLGDPYSYFGWRNLPGFTAPVIGGVPRLTEHPSGCGKVTARTVYDEDYSPSECNSIVDKGPWAAICTNLEELVVSMPLTVPAGSSENATHSRTLRVELVSYLEDSPIRTLLETREGEPAIYFGDAWNEPSPDDLGFIQFITAYANAMGSAEIIAFSKDINTAADQLRGSPQFEDMKGAGFTFIGVINNG